jgi:hypothetical protein
VTQDYANGGWTSSVSSTHETTIGVMSQEDDALKGIATDQFTASLIVKGKTVRTRPICAYPQYAKWNGTGSTDDAADFVCVSR